jgi:hypothetical protein
MLIDQATLERIRIGEVTLAFRRWKRPTVRAGGGLLTAAGRLAIGSIEPVDLENVTPAEALRAGFASVAELAGALGQRDGQLYRIELGPIGPDPRVALREDLPDAVGLDRIVDRLVRMDARSALPWTRDSLRLIADFPATRAGDLARRLGMERPVFKTNVRKLKAMGLTISLEVGYELSPRGRSVLDRLEARQPSVSNGDLEGPARG